MGCSRLHSAEPGLCGPGLPALNPSPADCSHSNPSILSNLCQTPPLVEGRARESKFQLKEEVEQLGKTMAQLVEERGRAQGREEGRAKGEARGRAGRLRGALETALTRRFGPLSRQVGPGCG